MPSLEHSLHCSDILLVGVTGCIEASTAEKITAPRVMPGQARSSALMEVAKCSPDLTVQNSVRDPEVTGKAGRYVKPLIDSADSPASGPLLLPLSLPVF
jgi:hypothetical protein